MVVPLFSRTCRSYYTKSVTGFMFIHTDSYHELSSVFLGQGSLLELTKTYSGWDSLYEKGH